MAKEVSTTFTVGDVVTLKLNPEFRGVVHSFYDANRFPTKSQSIDGLLNPNIWVTLSILNSDFKTEYKTVPILHLKHKE
jgi:hypothetical protein